VSLAAPSPRARLFLALWPDEAVRAELDRAKQTLHEECGGRAVKRENLHLTLMFLGAAERSRIPELEALMAAPRTPPFTLKFGNTGYWRHNHLVWAAPYLTPQPLTDLVAVLKDEFGRAGFTADDRPYAAHATLIRDARAPRRRIELTFAWEVADYALMESVPTPNGARYETLALQKLEIF
jgi:2'-5' RNA ligase